MTIAITGAAGQLGRKEAVRRRMTTTYYQAVQNKKCGSSLIESRFFALQIT